MDRLLKVQEVCNIVRMSATSVYRLIKCGKIPAIKIGDSWRVPAGELESMIKVAERRNEDGKTADGQNGL